MLIREPWWVVVCATSNISCSDPFWTRSSGTSGTPPTTLIYPPKGWLTILVHLFTNKRYGNDWKAWKADPSQSLGFRHRWDPCTQKTQRLLEPFPHPRRRHSPTHDLWKSNKDLHDKCCYCPTSPGDSCSPVKEISLFGWHGQIASDRLVVDGNLLSNKFDAI